MLTEMIGGIVQEDYLFTLSLSQRSGQGKEEDKDLPTNVSETHE